MAAAIARCGGSGYAAVTAAGGGRGSGRARGRRGLGSPPDPVAGESRRAFISASVPAADSSAAACGLAAVAGGCGGSGLRRWMLVMSRCIPMLSAAMSTMVAHRTRKPPMTSTVTLIGMARYVIDVHAPSRVTCSSRPARPDPVGRSARVSAALDHVPDRETGLAAAPCVRPSASSSTRGWHTRARPSGPSPVRARADSWRRAPCRRRQPAASEIAVSTSDWRAASSAAYLAASAFSRSIRSAMSSSSRISASRSLLAASRTPRSA